MRQITYHHGDPLNDGVRIEESDVAVDGKPKSYQFLLKQHGLWQSRARLDFHDGDDKDGPKGMTEECLLAVIIDRLEQCGPETMMTTEALCRLRTALLWLREGRRQKK